MSQTQANTVSDPVLGSPAGLWLPEGNDFTVDPQYGSVRIVLPICRAAFLNITRPKQIKQNDGVLGDPTFSATFLFNPAASMDIYRAIVAVANNRFPPEMKPDPAQPLGNGEFVQRSFTAEELLFIDPKRGGLHYPMRAGAENYMREPAKYGEWRDLFFLNASMKASDSNGNPQKPVYLDSEGRSCDPSIFYSGCYVLPQVTFFAYPKAGAQGRGSRGVGVGLNVVRFYQHGQKLGSFDAEKAASTAFAKIGNIPPPAQLPQQTGYGPHAGGPGSVPPGVVVPGFAAPPPQQQQYPQQQHYAPPQQGYQPPAPQHQQGQPIPPQPPTPGYIPAGARPPG